MPATLCLCTLVHAKRCVRVYECAFVQCILDASRMLFYMYVCLCVCEYTCRNATSNAKRMLCLYFMHIVWCRAHNTLYVLCVCMNCACLGVFVYISNITIAISINSRFSVCASHPNSYIHQFLHMFRS